MTTICILSEEKSDPLLRTLQLIFHEKQLLILQDGALVTQPSREEKTDFFILKSPFCRRLDLSPCLLLLHQYTGTMPEICPGSIAVVNSGDQKSQRVLQDYGVHTVTCGFLSKDVFTLSGIGEDSLTISLQRSIPSVYGNILEPGDTVLQWDGRKETQQHLLLAAVAGILCEIL